MMRKLTATGLAVVAVTVLTGAGAAFAASSHRPARCGRDLARPLIRDSMSVDRHTSVGLSQENSSRGGPRDAHTTDLSSGHSSPVGECGGSPGSRYPVARHRTATAPARTSKDVAP